MTPAGLACPDCGGGVIDAQDPEGRCWVCWQVSIGVLDPPSANGNSAASDAVALEAVGAIEATAASGVIEGGRGATDRRSDLVAIAARDVKPESVQWLWDGRIPIGMTTLLAGLPGLGKSTVSVKLTADVTRGELPGALERQPADVLLISFEDAKAETITPRLMAANADLARVHYVEHALMEGAIDLTEHLPEIDALAERHAARLLIIDPLVAALPAGKMSSHVDQDVRSVLAPLAALAERRELAVLALMHFSKSAVDALLGVGGSIGFVGAARSLLVFGADPGDERGEDGPARILAHRKCNVGRRRRSLQVWVQGRVVDTDEGGVETSMTIFGDECDVDADELVRPREKKVSPRVQAEKFLRDLLADGPHAASEVYDLAEDEDIAKRTLDRAKTDLDVNVFQKDRKWWWELPADEEELPPDEPPDEPELF